MFNGKKYIIFRKLTVVSLNSFWSTIPNFYHRVPRLAQLQNKRRCPTVPYSLCVCDVLRCDTNGAVSYWNYIACATDDWMRAEPLPECSRTRKPPKCSVKSVSHFDFFTTITTCHRGTDPGTDRLRYGTYIMWHRYQQCSKTCRTGVNKPQAPGSPRD